MVIIPGYGMAVAQAQHQVRELYDQLTKRGIDVKFAIHPVAGRMPGHMNVLLAEADIPVRPALVEMDEINPEMPQCDVALVIGANDVVNPAARHDKTSPIYGMPIIDADKAQTVFAIKRSMNPGFAGIDNELYFTRQHADALRRREGRRRRAGRSSCRADPGCTEGGAYESWFEHRPRFVARDHHPGLASRRAGRRSADRHIGERRIGLRRHADGHVRGRHTESGVHAEHRHARHLEYVDRPAERPLQSLVDSHSGRDAARVLQRADPGASSRRPRPGADNAQPAGGRHVRRLGSCRHGTGEHHAPFDGAGADSTPFTSYTDAGFTVAAVSGAWAVRTTYGHPAPYIGFTAPPGTAIGGEVRISAAGLPFSFGSVDLYSSTVSMPYVVTGLKNGATVFTVADVLPNPMGAFVTVPNPHATDVIDTLLISVTSPAAPCCPNPVGIDNIKVTD